MTIQIIALLLPIYTCLSFAVLFLTIRYNDKSPKTILGLFMTFTLIVHVYAFTIPNGNSILTSYLDGIFAASFLSLTPFFYLYILSLTDEDFSLKKELYHFIPSFIFLLVITTLHLFLSEREKEYYIAQHMMGDFSDNLIMKAIYLLSRAKGYVFSVQSILYFILSVKNISRHNETINNLFTKPEGLKLNWLYVFSIIYFFGSVNGAMIILIPLKELFSHDHILNSSLFIFAGSYFSYGLLGFRQKPVMSIIGALDSAIISNNDNKETAHELLIKIENYFTQNHAYLNPELKIWDIAQEMNTNRTYISKVINEGTGMNLVNYINHFRIRKACEYLLEANNKYLIEDISILCGFNSISSFNRAFRQKKGMSPSEYKNRKNNNS